MRMTANRFEICPASELEPGDRCIETLDGFSVGVFNVDGEYHAMKNDCPHQRAPLCEGKLTGTNTSDTPGEYNWERDGRIVTCPWHGWEFDVTTGESVFDPHAVKAKTFQTAVEGPEVGVDGDVSASGGGASASATGDCESCGVHIEGEEPPVETYDVAVENSTVVVYL
jgi:nitrite reductase/ring-hydroxylating ferredoxin subunit